MPTLAYFGIESSGLSLAVDLLILFVAVLYLSLIYWTYADARRRIVDPWLIMCATGASVFPFVGTIIYMVLRPPEYLEDVHERELETQAAEARLRQLDRVLCPHCSYGIEQDFIRCPSCLRKLKERCASCSRPLDQAWTICPYCEADVPGIAGTRSRRRRGGAPDIENDLGELDMPAALSDAPARSRRRTGAATEIDGELDAPTAVADTDADADATRAEPALAAEPAPARPRRSTGPGGRARPGS